MDSESGKPPNAAIRRSLHKKMMQLLSSLWVTHAIGTFARLGLADAMEAGADNARRSPRRAVSSRSRLSAAARALDLGIVTEAAGGHFALTPLGRMLTRTRRTRCAPRRTSHRIQRRDLEHLDGALAGGIAFEALKGKPLFDWLHANPDEARASSA